MIQPQFEILPDDHDDEQSRLLEVGRITPVYESLGGSLASRWIRRTIYDLLQELKGHIAETLPEALCSPAQASRPRRSPTQRSLPARPERRWPICRRGPRPAHRRLIFEELFISNSASNSSGRKFKERARALPLRPTTEVREAIRQVLPFIRLPRRRRSLAEIVADMRPR